MSLYLKELIVVLGLGVIVFALAKPVALQFSAENDFNRRRNVWIVLTIAAFLSPNIWLFALVAIPALYWGGTRDSNPVAFYLLLLTVIPPISRAIPTIAIKELFDLDIYRLLSLCVLIPAAWRLRKSPDPHRIRGLRGMDLLLLGYGALQVLLFVPPDPAQSHYVILHNSATNVLRTAFLFYIDVYILYYVASRTGTTRGAIRDALAAFVLSCGLMASIAVFEAVRHWLLYTDLFARWGGDRLRTEYYVREGLLRAEASSGQPLALGYLLTVGFGFWLYLQSRVTGARGRRVVVTTVLLAGLFVSFSRGPWLAALVVFLAYSAFGPGRASRLMKATILLLVLGGLVVLSPLGTQLRATLPFSGSEAAQSSLTYREQLFDRSWEIIRAHPFLGDQLALSHMQGLRQGQGIIDVVNTYLGVTLYHGFAGLALFLAFLLLPLYRMRRIARQLLKSDPDAMLLAAAISATFVGIVILLADSGLHYASGAVFYILIGTAEAYLAVLYSTRSQPAPRTEARSKSPIAVSESH
ncbi:MAG TPA: O-antigen ligase family protein [Steroidobacteraceae bacterium]|nr:O-antigen ligase family protein [Steroidobacteraceae bacterium]